MGMWRSIYFIKELIIFLIIKYTAYVILYIQLMPMHIVHYNFKLKPLEENAIVGCRVFLKSIYKTTKSSL